MKNIVTMAVIALLLSTAIAAVGQSRSVPRGAFIRKPVSSVEELAAQCASDPVVRERFAKHFGVKREQLDEYLREHVVIGTVKADTPKSVYIVTRSGRVIHERKVLKRGQPVFMLKDTGEPLLVQACGNPVLKELPPRIRIGVKPSPTYEVMRANEVPREVGIPRLAPPVMAEAPPDIVPIAPPPQYVPAPPIAQAPDVSTRVGRPFPWFLAPLALVGIGDGGRGEGPPVIPEPGGAAMVFATAAASVLGYGIRRRRAAGRAEEEFDPEQDTDDAEVRAT